MEIGNIKFKAKKTLDGKWIKGDLVHHRDSDNVWITDYENQQTSPVDPFTVCPFTGAKDCDGTSIYEHDLLRHEKTDSTYEVVWNQGNTSFSLVDTEYAVLYPTNTMGRMLRNRQLKVVGNKLDKK